MLVARSAASAMLCLVIKVEATGSTRAQTRSNAVNHALVIVIASLLLMVGSDCREREKPKRRWEGVDGGVVFRAECRDPFYYCEKDCYERKASPACDRCCLDEDYLCQLGRQHDYSLCKGSR